MHCSQCDHRIDEPDALFCTQCGQRLATEERCHCCGKQLQGSDKFCSRCGASTNQTTVTNFWRPLYCQGSGSAILPGDRHFLCHRCGKTFLEKFRHQEQACCLDCAAQQQIVPSDTAEASQPQHSPTTNIFYPEQKDDYYRIRLQKLGIAEQDWAEIPAGEFAMGSPQSEINRFDNEHQHEASVDSFYLLKTPVTFKMYDIYCDELKIPRPADEGWGRDLHPVINITYWQAIDYCIWLQKKSGWNIRLPTEAEWEYACRAGTTTPFWTGETITSDQANFDGNFTYGGSERGIRRGSTTPVDEFTPNPWGLHDMHGNVWEWCGSLFDEAYTGLEQQDAGSDRDNLLERVVRGGSWYNVPGGLRSASRNKMGPNYHYLRIGFRILREAEAQ